MGQIYVTTSVNNDVIYLQTNGATTIQIDFSAAPAAKIESPTSI